jgi:hypothetical protein
MDRPVLGQHLDELSQAARAGLGLLGGRFS